MAYIKRNLEKVIDQATKMQHINLQGLHFHIGSQITINEPFKLLCDKIKELVAQYYRDFKENKKEYQDGERITYAARVFDEKEMCALTDATLDFWLTTGRFSDQFEKEFAKWIGVKFAHLVNS